MSTNHAPRIAVVGSLNMDLVLQVQHAPGPGETVLADALHLVPGGKGGNQAVACARQGAQVALFGRVGDDGYGHTLRAGLDADGIDHSGVQTDTATTTGVAAITVEARAKPYRGRARRQWPLCAGCRRAGQSAARRRRPGTAV